MTKQTSASRRPLRRNQPSLARLEPRMMFDGAAVVDVAAAVADPLPPPDHAAFADAPAAQAEPAPVEAARPESAPEASPPAAAAIETGSRDAAAQAQSTGPEPNADAVERQAREAIADHLGGSDGLDRLVSVFGTGATPPPADWIARADALRGEILDGGLHVDLMFADATAMKGAYAAFAADGPAGAPVIFVNRDWWQAQTDTGVLARTLVEEYGHAIDHRLNPGADTAGDEGEAFAARVLNVPVNVIDEARIAAENDHRTVEIDGVSYAVETASLAFINAYRVYTGAGFVAEKEQNRHHFIDEALGATLITDQQLSSTFSGNDVVAKLTANGVDYYGWVSRPIKDGGIVRGFYFWYDTNFTSLADATTDGNTDGDRATADNNAFILVVDQAWFDGLAVTGTAAGINKPYKFVGSSSDRVDSALNALIIPNRAPTPAADSRTVVEDGGATAGNVLTNDTDADGNPLTVTGFSINGAAGTLGQAFAITGVGSFTLSANGAYSFTPSANYAGPVPAITYTVSDGTASATGTLSIAITPVNDAPAGADRTITLDEGTFHTFSAADFGFTDPNDSPANSLSSVVITTLPTAGTLSLNGTAITTAGQEVALADLTKLRFTPAANAAGTGYATFTFQVRDNGGTANGGVNLDATPNTITVNVTNVNSAPTAAADTATAVEAGGVSNGTAGTNPTGFLLANDTDPDGDALSVASVAGYGSTSAAGGTFTVTGRYGTLTVTAATGANTYTVDNNNAAVQALRTVADTLAESFVYTAADPGNLRSTSTLTVTIQGANDAPSAVNDANVAKESIASSGNYLAGDTTGYTATGDVLKNDTDADSSANGETKVIAGLFGSAVSGTVTAGATSTQLTFQAQSTLSPVTVGDFVYHNGAQLKDANGVAITVSSKTDLGNSNYAMTLSATPTVSLAGQVVAFDSKNQATTPNSAKTATVSTSTSVGQTTVNVSSVSGTLAAGMSMSWTGGSGSPATIASVVYDGSGNVTQLLFNSTVSITAGTALTFTGSAGATLTGRYGTLQLAANGSYIYTPTANNAGLSEGQSGTDTFSYRMQDAAGATSTGTLTITVLGSGVNDPTAVADNNTIAENTTTGVTGAVLTNDTTPTGTGTLSVKAARHDAAAGETAVTAGTTSANGTSITGTYGTLVIGANGSYTYTLDNSNPTVNALRTTSNTLTDVFFYRILNATALREDVTTLTITITGANDAPVAVADTATAREAGGYSNGTSGLNPTGNTLTNDTDVDAGDGKSVYQIYTSLGLSSAVTAGTTSSNGASISGTYGTLTMGADGSHVYTVNNANNAVQALRAGQTLTDTFFYRITDTAGLTSTSTLTITIEGANDAPTNTVPASAATVAEAASVALSGISVADVDDANLTVQLTVQNGTLTVGNLNGATVQSGASGSATVTLTGTKAQVNAALGTLSYQGAAGYSGTDLLTVRTADAGGLVAVSTLDITVSPDNRALTVTGTTVNEASPYILFSVAGAAGQSVTLALQSTGSGAGHAGIGTDLLPNLEYFDGTAWTAYTGAAVTIPVGGTLLVRSAIIGDAVYEGSESIRLAATNKAGTTYTGDGAITDGGTGAIYLATNTTGTADTTGIPSYLDDDRTVSVNDIAVNEASPYAVFTVTGNANQVIRLGLVSGTATSPADYGPGLEIYDGAAWVAYTPGTDHTMTGTILLVRTTIVNDAPAVFEGQEAFQLAVTRVSAGSAVYGTASVYDDGTGGVYLAGNTTGTANGSGDTGYPAALDDDRTLTVDSPTVNEASDYAVFTLTGNSGQTVTLALSNQTATINTAQTLKIWDGLDWVNYDPAAALPTFDANGKIHVRVDITAEKDSVLEGPETFQLTAMLTGRTTSVTGTATIKDDGTGVIHDTSTGPFTEKTTGLDNDSPTITHVGNGTVGSITVTEGSAAVFTANLSNASNTASTFALALTGGTATLGTDFTSAMTFTNGVTYNSTTGQITVPAGVTSFTITVPTTDDAVKEASEAFTLTIGGVAGTGTITDNDTIAVNKVGNSDGSLSTVTVTEGTAAVFTVSLTTSSTTAETFALALASGTATLGADFTSAMTFSNGVTYDTTTGLVTVPAGVTSFTVTVPTTDDTAAETSESFTLTVGGVAGTGTITDNDAVSVSKVGSADGTLSNVTVTEGQSVVFTVALSVATTSVETFALALTGGTATLGTDFTSTMTFSNGVTYDSTTGQITVPAGVSSFTVTVPTTDDAVKESSEAFTLTVGGIAGTGTITDNDSIAVNKVGNSDGSLSSVTVTEGTSAVFTVSLTTSSTSAETFTLALTGGTATLGTDFTSAMSFSNGVTYDSTTGQITVPAGVTSFTVTVPTTDDAVKESSEAFTLTIGGVAGTGTISDNDTIAVNKVGNSDGSLSTVTVTEGTSAVFTVSLTTSSTSAETFALSLASGTATLGTDFTSAMTFSNGVTYDTTTGLVTVPAGVTSFTITVPTTDDAVKEASEGFALTVGGVGGTGTITDNDVIGVDKVGKADGSPGSVTVTEGTAAVFTVSLTTTSTSAETFALALAGGTATLGTDFTSAMTFSNGVTYDSTTGQITVPAGVSSFTVTVPTTDDTVMEASEAFTLTVGSVAGTGTITDNDVLSVGTVGSVTVTEGAAAVFTVALSASSASTETFALTLAGGSATLGTDFTAAMTFSNGVTYDSTTGLVTVPAGVTSFTVTVPTTDDAVKESAESFTLTVGGVAGTGTITDNDAVSVGSIGGVSVTEGRAAVFTVSLTGSSTTAETFALALASGTATLGADFTGAMTFSNGVTYDAASGRITVPAGVTGFTVTVPTSDDAVKELTEDFTLSVGGVTGSGTITDNDNVSVDSVGNVAVTEGNAAVFTVSLSTSSSSAETFALTLTGGTATLGADFTGAMSFSNGVTYDVATGRITVPAGVTSFTVTVPTTDDAVVETAEGFTLAIGGAVGTATITDNDTAGVRGIGGADGTLGAVTVTEGNAAVFTVSLTASSASAETYALALTGGSATLGADFTAAMSFSNGVTYDAGSGRITVPAGVTSFTVTVPTIDDAVREASETFTLTVGGIAGTGTIADNDSLAVSGVGGAGGALGIVTVTEGQAVVFNVALSGSSSMAETFALSLTSGTAALGGDFTAAMTFSNGVTYDATTGRITVPAGVTGFTVTVPTTDDAVTESTESFTLTVGGMTGTANIIDNDTIAVQGVGGPGVAVTEGAAAVFTVTLTNSSATAETFQLALADGSATLGSDFTAALLFSDGVTYDAATGRVMVPAGVTSFTVTVPTVDDTVVEPVESFTLTVGAATGTVTIADNDTAPPPPQLPPAQVEAPAPAQDSTPAPTNVTGGPVTPPPQASSFAPLVEPAIVPASVGTMAILPEGPGDAVRSSGQYELRVDKPIPDVLIPPGTSTITYVMPVDAFKHTDPNAKVELTASMIDGKPLPPWLKFDPVKGAFTGSPPDGYKGELQIKVVARDEAGRQAETMIRLKVGEAGERRAELQGKPGLTRQLRAEGVLAWKADRERLVQQARDAALAGRAVKPGGLAA